MGCNANNNGNNGIVLANGVAQNCHIANNGNLGIYVAPGTVSGCWIQNSGHSGIYVNLPGCQVIGNTCIGNNTSFSTSDAGIYVNDSNNRIEDNHVTSSGFSGIRVNGLYSGNIVVKNSVSGSSIDFNISGNQIVGPFITTFGTITNSNPWANFSY